MLASITLSLCLLATPSAKPGRSLLASPAPKALQAPSKDSTLPEPDSLFLNVTVGPSQTLSWIGLRNFGAWTPEIAHQVLRDNPQLHSSALAPGQILRLRKSLDRRGLPPLQQIQMASRRAVVTRVSGDVRRILPGGVILPLASDQFLAAGERIHTGAQSMAELIIDNQSILRLRANSQLELVYFQDSAKLATKKAGTQVRLGFGRVWTKVRKWAGPLVGFEVRMPSAIAGVHGTIFECQVNPDSSSQVWVDEGVVGVRGAGSDSAEIAVTRGKSVVIDSTGTVESPQTEALPDPLDLLPDPSLDTRNLSPDDLRASVEKAVAKRDLAEATVAKFPEHPGPLDIVPRRPSR